MELVFASPFFWLFLAFYLVHEVICLVLDLLNYRFVKSKTAVPELFQGYITQAVFLKAKEYTLEKIQFSLTAHFAFIPFFWFLVFRNGFNVFDFYAAKIAGFGTLSHSVVFCLLLALYFGIVSLPFKIYAIFVIEEKYGFNHMSFGLFVFDLAKSLGLGLLLGVPVMYLVFWFMNVTGSFWWLWVWLAITAFQLMIVGVYPTFLAPLFNKFQPLKEGTLKDRILALAAMVRFKLSGIFVIDGSTRSSHSNAYFAGMGRYRRIVLFDTLIGQLSEDELLAVLAHEMGHNIKRHMFKMMLITSLYALIGFYLLSLAMSWGEFYKAFNLATVSHHAALVIFVLSYETFTFLFIPFLNWLSRRHEYEADYFAVNTTAGKAAMQTALVKLSRDNLANLTPHPAYSFYHYSHPALIERLSAIEKIE